LTGKFLFPFFYLFFVLGWNPLFFLVNFRNKNQLWSIQRLVAHVPAERVEPQPVMTNEQLFFGFCM
jgi:hypothetical protein